MIGGQIIDLEGESKKLSFDQLLMLHSLKTGKMIEVSARLGCIAAGYDVNDPVTEKICSYARKIGLAFQVIDDLLDVIGDEATVGKSLCSDAENKKTTFMNYFDLNGAKKYAEDITRSAIEDVDQMEDSDILQELALYLLERNM
jgi:geranylgeranyl diphosphate synthase type II